MTITTSNIRLGISDARRKGQNTKVIHGNYVLVYSGVDKNKKATHGVGLIIHPEKAQFIYETEFISERIIWVQIVEQGLTTTYIQIYAPCNDNNNEIQRHEFFKQVSDTINRVNEKDELVLMGNFNGRVGKKQDQERCLGYFSDTTNERNSNGEELINLCFEQDLTITNTL